MQTRMFLRISLLILWGYFAFICANNSRAEDGSTILKGDQATLSVQSSLNRIEQWLVTEVNEEKNTVSTLVKVTYINDKTPEPTLTQQSFNLTTLLRMASVVENCVDQFHGKVEPLEVRGGKFEKVCHVSVEAANYKLDTYYANEFPFYPIKEIKISDGSTSTTELVDLVRAQP